MRKTFVVLHKFRARFRSNGFLLYCWRNLCDATFYSGNY